MLALQGYTPLDAYNILKMEDLMKFEDFMSPLANSHTMTGEEVKENGRPNKAEETGDINRTPELDDNAGSY